MESTSVRESGYVTDSEEIEKQFLADLEKAKALSMETAALEKFRHMAPAAASNTGDNPTRSRITQSNSCSTTDQRNGEKGSILFTSLYNLLVLRINPYIINRYRAVKLLLSISSLTLRINN